MARSLEEIQKDYNVLCAQLGQATYRIEALAMETRGTERDVERLLKQIKKVNIEAAQAQGKEVASEDLAETGAPSAESAS